MQLLEDIVAKADEYFEGVSYKVEEQSVSVSRISNAADELVYYEAEVVCLRVTEH